MANGIPPLLTGDVEYTNVIIVRSDSVSVANQFQEAQWGIYIGDVPAIIPTSIVGAEIKRTWKISDYPQERGAFESYNKVTTPTDSRVTLAQAGGHGKLQSFLSDLDSISETVNVLFNVVTPDKVYADASISHYNYKRTASNGVSMIVAEVWLTEIRQTVTATSVKTSEPSGAQAEQGGQLQPGSSVFVPGVVQ